MELREHPEHGLYQEHRQQMENYRRAVTAWLAGDRARAQVESLLSGLIPLLQTYNRVLWEHFPYCSQCLGGCCVVGATDLKPIDYVALVFLEEDIPTRPERTGLDEHACIYLTPQGCSWPARWRPLKCALFYCLGSGAIAVDASDARYAEITDALQAAIAPRLGRLLPDDAASLLALLPDPVAFADALSAALDRQYLSELYEAFPGLRPQPVAAPAAEADPATSALDFIATATEQLWSAPPPPPPGSNLTADQFLSDLETLAWILEGRPGNPLSFLAEMRPRYPEPVREETIPTLWQQMAYQLDQLAQALAPEPGNPYGR